MKTLILLMTATVLMTFQNCKKSSTDYIPNGDCLTILIDRTDNFKATSNITVNDFLPLLKVTASDPTASANIRLAPISNIRFERTYFVGIPETNEYQMNELDRKDLIDTIKNQISSFLRLIKSTPCGTDKSSIYESIALELQSLSTCNVGTRKRMVIISDLLENTAWFNAYNAKELDYYIEHQSSFNKKLDKYCPIRYVIKGIIINLVHQPKSVIEDEQFYQISNLLMNYYESKGAIVHISSTLNK